jgi:hypothetical protein
MNRNRRYLAIVTRHDHRENLLVDQLLILHEIGRPAVPLAHHVRQCVQSSDLCVALPVLNEHMVGKLDVPDGKHAGPTDLLERVNGLETGVAAFLWVPSV